EVLLQFLAGVLESILLRPGALLELGLLALLLLLQRAARLLVRALDLALAPVQGRLGALARHGRLALGLFLRALGFLRGALLLALRGAELALQRAARVAVALLELGTGLLQLALRAPELALQGAALGIVAR